MSFLFPQFLWGLLALTIPIIIHLFNFRKAKRVYFSNNSMLRNIKEAKTSKLNLKHWLVLACRLFFISLLVFAFAQPFIAAEKESLEGKDVILYLDNSLSMTNETEEGLMAIDQALDYSNHILDLYPKGTMFQLLTNEFATTYHFSSKDEISEQLKELRSTAISRSIPEVLNRINFNQQQNQHKRKDIYLISDFQKSTSEQPDKWELNPDMKYYLLPTDYKSKSNVFIDTVYLENPFLVAQEKNSIQVIVRNEGDADVEDLILKLYINEVQVSNASVDIPSNSKEPVKFDLLGDLPQYSRCRISFEEFPVSFDNDFYFDLHAADKIKVLDIRGEEYSENIAKAFGNTQLYTLATYQAANLDYNRVRSSDLIILNEIETIEPSLASVLREFVQNKGYILFIPSSKANAANIQELIPLSISKLKSEKRKALARLDQDHPLFKGIFEEDNERFEMPAANKLWNFAGDVEKLLVYKTGEVFLGRGGTAENIFVLATPLKDEFTNFQKHALFIPVLYRIAALSKQYTESLYFNVSQSFVVLKVDEVASDQVFKLKSTDQELIPAQRTSQKGLFLEIPKDVLNPGFYTLSLQDETKSVLSFNFDKRESVLAQYEVDKLKAQFEGKENIEIYKGENTASFAKEMKQKHYGVELWKYALLLALFFLFVEILLIRFL